MITIRSIEKLATSNSDGLCDISRQMLSYNENLENGIITIMIKDKLFQENEITYKNEAGDYVTIMERIIIEDRPALPFKFTNKELDKFFIDLGEPISKDKSYTDQQNINKINILIAQTISAAEDGSGWNNMTDWMPDTDHMIVNNFSK